MNWITMQPTRESILNRKPVKDNGRNTPNIDKEHQEQLQKIQVKREKYQDFAENRKLKIYGTKRDKSIIKEQIQNEAAIHAEIKTKLNNDIKLKQQIEDHNIKAMHAKKYEEYDYQLRMKKEEARLINEENKRIAQEKIKRKELEKKKNMALENEYLKTDPHKSVHYHW